MTARNVDIGDYVAAGSGNQLFREARTSPLRVYIRVPQAFTPLVKPGDEADLTLDEFPGRTFQARRSRLMRCLVQRWSSCSTRTKAGN